MTSYRCLGSPMATWCLPMKFCDVSDQRTSSQTLSFMLTVSTQNAAVLKALPTSGSISIRSLLIQARIQFLPITVIICKIVNGNVI